MSNNPRAKKITLFFKGFAMGIADIIPGVSGGTIAFITGIYEELVATIHNFNLKFFTVLRKEGFVAAWRLYNLSFLLTLILGIVTGFLLLARWVTYLLENHPVLIYSFIFGLVAFSVLFVSKQIKKWNFINLAGILIFMVLGYAITVIEPGRAPDSYWYLFFSGAIAIIAMILPGISGSFILILLGSYIAVLTTLNDFTQSIINRDFAVLITSLLKLLVFVGGILVGIKIFSGILTWLFSKHKDLVLAILTGLMIGAMNKIWPWKITLSTYTNSKGEEIPLLEKSVLPQSYPGEPQIFWAMLLALAGFLFIFLIEKIAVSKKNRT